MSLVSGFAMRNNNSLFIENDASLVGYWDMETFSGALLIDKSRKKNHLECLINNIVSSCTNPYFSLNSNNSIKNR
jgi:hypothetical protein